MSITTRTPLACGSWPSEITIDSMLGSSTGLGGLGVDGDDLYWLESRPGMDGRSLLVRRTETGTEDVTPVDANVRSRVHEYGGGTWHADGGIVAWCSDTDSSVHVVEDGVDRALTPSNPQLHYGGLRVVAARRLVLAVREDHRGEGESITTIVALKLDDDNADGGTVLVEGCTFYAHPEFSFDGKLAWTEWDHPNMPWDAARVCTAPVADDLTVGETSVVAGGDEVSNVHPRWASNGHLYFMSDRTGFWNPWVFDGTQTRQLLQMPNDFCRPVWVQGNDAYALIGAATLVLSWYDDARARVGILDVTTGQLSVMPTELADANDLVAGAAGVFLKADFANREGEIVELRPVDVLMERDALTTLRKVSETEPDPAGVSVGESIWFDGRDGRAQTWYYPPTNPSHQVPEGELPPVIVNTHGGPTGMAPAGYNPGYQFWTSRGFAVLDVNYSGSAGFGREYRNRLYGNWGVADVDDAVDAVKAVVERGLVDPERVVIQGGSAGGYTTLQALVSSDVFAAGVSRYGIGDLEMLATDTHKFEARYLDKIVGDYPEQKQRYLDRSPIHHVDRLSSPMLILQGLDDKVVPPNQAEAMADAVRAKQLPVALMMFEGEGHGFRKQSTRRAVVEAQLSFFSQLFGFTPADEVPHLEIENL